MEWKRDRGGNQVCHLNDCKIQVLLPFDYLCQSHHSNTIKSLYDRSILPFFAYLLYTQDPINLGLNTHERQRFDEGFLSDPSKQPR